ncbi:MAG: sigma-54 dependent transcriptional regulator [Gemmataceae bacterium]|nr:sigma-54 dependent transcriptional regulator [Gemmataceae bacterium]
MKTLLVIDDEESVRYSIESIFASDSFAVATARHASEGLALALQKQPDVILLDYQLPDRSGLELMRELREATPKTPVIFITAQGTTQTAIEAMKLGAFEYLLKPLDLERLEQVISRAFEASRFMAVPAVMPAEDVADQIIGRSAVMQEMCKQIGRIARQDVNVLILGESGTGKELVARALYTHSRRSDKQFLAINCAAIPETLLESELFGHEAGAFTGANRRRIGKFEQCHGGTLFLDEIGDLTPGAQAKLLRVLQDQRFERVGGAETIDVKVRIFAATNQDLAKLVAEGRFRKDLYYRLNSITVLVPPLQQRLEDVSELAHYFLFRFNRELNLDFRGFAPETIERLQQYAWPGNVRELQGVIQQAMLNASGHLILPEFLPSASGPLVPPEPIAAEPSPIDLPAVIRQALAEQGGRVHETVIGAVERLLFAETLRHSRGNQAKAAEILGLNRATLRHRLRSLNLTVDKVPADRE